MARTSETPVRTANIITINGVPRINPLIARGTYISHQDLEKALRCGFETNRFRLRLLRMLRAFERDTVSAGDPKGTKSEGNGVRILTDAEAAEYYAGRYKCGISQTRTAYRRMSYVRRSELSGDDADRYDRELLCQSRELSALAQARRRRDSMDMLISAALGESDE